MILSLACRILDRRRCRIYSILCNPRRAVQYISRASRDTRFVDIIKAACQAKVEAINSWEACQVYLIIK